MLQKSSSTSVTNLNSLFKDRADSECLLSKKVATSYDYVKWFTTFLQVGEHILLRTEIYGQVHLT